QRIHSGTSEHGLDRANAGEIDDGDHLAGDVRKAVVGCGQQYWRPLQLGLKAFGKIVFDYLASRWGLEVARLDHLTVLSDGQQVGGAVEPAVQAGEPLVAHQHQKLDFWQPLRRLGIEPARAVLDGVAAVRGKGLADPQRHAAQGLWRQAFDGVAVKA